MTGDHYPYFKDLVSSEGWKRFIQCLEKRKLDLMDLLVTSNLSSDEIKYRMKELKETSDLVDNYITDVEYEQKEKRNA